jgi:hypothetical protein
MTANFCALQVLQKSGQLSCVWAIGNIAVDSRSTISLFDTAIAPMMERGWEAQYRDRARFYELAARLGRTSRFRVYAAALRDAIHSQISGSE